MPTLAENVSDTLAPVFPPFVVTRIGVDVGETLNGIHNAVHHNERVISGRNAPGAANTDGGGLAGFAAAGEDIHTGNPALKRLVSGSRGGGEDFLHAHNAHGTGKVRLLLGAVANDDGIVKHLGVRHQDHVDLFAVVDALDIVLETKAAEYQDVKVPGLDAVFAVFVRDDAGCGALNENGGPGNGHSVITSHLAGNGAFLLGEHAQACSEQQDNQ